MNKPIAWTDKRQLSRPYPHSDAMTMWVQAYPEQGIDIPLYIHPVKELTQGEIHAVWASGQYYTLDKEGNVDEIRFEDFAKAILRKAQEK